MSRETQQSSLRETIKASIGDFLYNEGFVRCEVTPLGILEIINLISDYQEEGAHLFPEVLLTNNFEYFKTIPNREIIIKEAALEVGEFKNIIKLCAPLAINSWIIFIEITKDKLKYGVASAEMSETSPSIYRQTVGDLGLDLGATTIAYIRNIGQKTVELIGIKRRLVVSLTLDDTKNLLNNQIMELSNSTCSQLESYKVQISNYFEKIISEALKIGHGNLIGIVADSDEVLLGLKGRLGDGVYLKEPIDISSLIEEAETQRSNETSIALKAYSSVFISMMNHDGITIISDKGRIIAYHVFISNFIPDEIEIVGGARTRAFESMKYSNLFECCFYKSQDGNIKFWKNHE